MLIKKAKILRELTIKKIQDNKKDKILFNFNL